MADQMKESVFLLTASSSHDDFLQLAKTKSWRLSSQHDGDGEVTGFAQAWISTDGLTEIHYVHEPLLDNLRFIILLGPNCSDIIDLLFSRLQLRTSINVVRVASQAATDEEKCRSALELAVVFIESDPRALKILENYYQNGSEIVRCGVAKALAYRGWPEGIAFLEHIARVDDYSDLRVYANNMVSMWRSKV